MMEEKLTTKQTVLLNCLPNGYLPSTALQFLILSPVYRSNLISEMKEERLIRESSYVDDSKKKQTYRTYSITKKGYAYLVSTLQNKSELVKFMPTELQRMILRGDNNKKQKLAQLRTSVSEQMIQATGAMTTTMASLLNVEYPVMENGNDHKLQEKTASTKEENDNMTFNEIILDAIRKYNDSKKTANGFTGDVLNENRKNPNGISGEILNDAKKTLNGLSSDQSKNEKEANGFSGANMPLEDLCIFYSANVLKDYLIPSSKESKQFDYSTHAGLLIFRLNTFCVFSPAPSSTTWPGKGISRFSMHIANALQNSPFSKKLNNVGAGKIESSLIFVRNLENDAADKILNSITITKAPTSSTEFVQMTYGDSFLKSFLIPTNMNGQSNLNRILNEGSEFEYNLIREAMIKFPGAKLLGENAVLSFKQNETKYFVGCALNLSKIKSMFGELSFNKVDKMSLICFRWQRDFYEKIFPTMEIYIIG